MKKIFFSAAMSIGLMLGGVNSGECAVVTPEKIKEWTAKAEAGDPEVQRLLGFMYYTGEGVPLNSKEALKWYRKASEAGDAAAQRLLGFIYFLGLDTPGDNTEAIKWWRKAAEQGDAMSQYWMGQCYFRGTGAAKDLKTAEEWYHKACNNALELGCEKYAKMLRGEKIE